MENGLFISVCLDSEFNKRQLDTFPRVCVNLHKFCDFCLLSCTLRPL